MQLINGRLAQLGFVAALGAELATDESVMKQVSEQPAAIAAVFLLFIAGSLVPLMQGKKVRGLRACCGAWVCVKCWGFGGIHTARSALPPSVPSYECECAPLQPTRLVPPRRCPCAQPEKFAFFTPTGEAGPRCRAL